MGVSAGATDNAVGATFTDEGRELDRATEFARTRAVLGYERRTPTGTQSLLYVGNVFTYMRGPQTLRLDHELSWVSRFAPVRDLDLGLTLTGAQGRTSDLDFFAGTNRVGSAALPGGAERFASFTIEQDVSWQMNTDWALYQSFYGNGFWPLEDDPLLPRTLAGEANLGLDRTWTRDGLGVGLRAGEGRSSDFTFELPPDVTSRSRPVPPDFRLRVDARRAQYGEASLHHDHEWSERWRTRLSGGYTLVRVPDGRDSFAAPSGNLTLAYRTRAPGELRFFVDRGVYANTLVGDVFLQTGVGLRVRQPVGPWHKLLVTGGIDYQHSRSVFVVDTDQGDIDVWIGRGALTYEAGRYLRYILEARYTHQDAGASTMYGFDFPPTRMRRLMAVLTLELVYPAPEPPREDRRRGAQAAAGADHDDAAEAGQVTTAGEEEEIPGEGAETGTGTAP